ncbi:MAG: efflux RND transporter periplasmic adaptor subunit [Cyanobacteria bacterium SZAS TMP-1]|nr:efflux RND transporter periplasmic adaptor subunit [Cyanobacteria bacterium SZAS TMP-1]
MNPFSVKSYGSPGNRARALLVTALTVAATSSCSKKEEAPAVVDAIPDVQTTKVTQKILSRVDQLPGEIRAYQDVAVYPKVPGFIKWIGVDRGSKVKKGQVMVRLAAPELGAQRYEASSKADAAAGQVQEAKAKLAAAKASLLEARAQLNGDNDTYQRTKEASLVPGVVAPNDVVVLEQKVNADREKVNAWQENVEAAEKQLQVQQNALSAAVLGAQNHKDIQDYLTIVAPFDGYVTERNMHVGSFVGPRGQDAYPPIVNVQQLNLLRIITPVPEIDVGGVVPGARVEFTVSTHPGERFVGTVARLGNYLEPKTRTMPVELNYWNPDWRVLPGMFCEVYWPTRRKNPSFFVPSLAVETTSTLETFVIRINPDNKLEWVKVKRGQPMADMVEVFGELKNGDRVALKADDSLKPGLTVHAVEEQQ